MLTIGKHAGPGAGQSADRARIVADPPDSVDAFTDAVILADGLDATLIATEQRKQVRRTLAAEFGEPESPLRRRNDPR